MDFPFYAIYLPMLMRGAFMFISVHVFGVFHLDVTIF